MLMDRVHDTQEIFRMILDCMAKPGTISELSSIVEPLSERVGCSPAMFSQAITLLDGEVSFHIIGENNARVESYFSSLTFSKEAPLSEANYIFILKDAAPEKIQEVFRKVDKGTLENPDQSATILIEVERLSNNRQLVFTGPGIQKSAHAEIAGYEHWLAVRAEKNREYPLGVDLILMDSNSKLMCIPRTTRIEKLEVV